MAKKSRKWLLDNGFKDKSIGNVSTFTKELTGKVVVDPPPVHTSEAMEYWKNIHLKEVRMKLQENGMNLQMLDEYIKEITDSVNMEQDNE